MRLEIRFIRYIISVRALSECTSENVRLWDELQPGGIHTKSGLTYEQLRQLGEGVHSGLITSPPRHSRAWAFSSLFKHL